MKYNRYLLILPPPLSGSKLRVTRQRNGCSPQRAMPHHSVNEERERELKLSSVKKQRSQILRIEPERMPL